ncbi:hypothetical protein DFH07DRAFT_921881 [Mycena maculata]|uniref:Xylosidase/arabinosidase n=1 Tax=Mycena maculata TaxID=230809 RepID=A0AAD7IYA5_9AGAR|nr:hypothetical protein DFH07DRAFT_921881 [Mycena maculata]
MPTADAGKVLKRANPGTIQDKFLVGYQGWFTCGGDGPPIGEGHHGWLHWLSEPLTPPFHGRPNTDLWPDTSTYDASELYPVAGLTHRDGAPARVFSSRDPRTVRRHFRWMAEHGVDGAFLQRFVGQVDPEDGGNRDGRYGGTRRLRDEVGERVREAAEAEGRVWAIMYDVSGVPPSALLRIITADFTHLVHDLRVFDSPAYLRERGAPVVGVWGLGLSDARVGADEARAVLHALRAIAQNAPHNPQNNVHAKDGELYIFAGTPSHWRTPGEGDAQPDADGAWAGLWLGARGMVDAISPWSVGRFGDRDEVERWAAERWGGDAERVAEHNERGEGRRVDYVPVVLPGGSGFNLSEGKWAFNGIKRDGGKFLWAQVFHAKRLRGVRSLYGAMWDEYDEGTAFLPVVEKKRLLPEHERWPFMALDEDGYDLPGDWYMRIAGFAAEGLRSERRIFDSFPSKELQDYWAARPRYEDAASLPSSSASASYSASTYSASTTASTAAAAASTAAGAAPSPSSSNANAGTSLRSASPAYGRFGFRPVSCARRISISAAPGVGHSASLSARPRPPTQGPSLRPDSSSAPRPTTPSYASYPGNPAPGGGGYAASPPPPHGPRPTTPGYPGQARPPGAPHHASYPTQFPTPNPNPNGPPASFPGSSYNPPPGPPPGPGLPSPEIPGPSFPPGPMASQHPYPSPPHGPNAYAGPQAFPAPHPQGYSPPAGPPYPQAGPSFPPGAGGPGPDNAYFYQQPHFPSPGAGPGYSPPPGDMYNNYGQQPQGPWAPGHGPMPHQPGYGAPVSYGPGGPNPAPPPPPPSSSFGFATSSMDKIVGRRTRQQLEGTVDSITQSSTKLLHKFL